jgi:hypothetical protein
MTDLSYSNIFHYVKAQLDELSNNDDAMLVASDQAVEDLEKEIEASMLQSVRTIHLDAPNVLLRDGVPFDEKHQPFVEYGRDEEEYELVVEPNQLIFSPDGGSINVVVRTVPSWTVSVNEGEPTRQLQLQSYTYLLMLPDNFLRLITLQMDDWERPIQTLVNEDSAEYRKQSNKYLRGTYKKPIGAIVHQSGYPFIRLFSCTTNMASLMYGQYVPEPTKYGDGDSAYVKICEPLRYPCLNQITANVLRGIGRAQEAALYDRMAVQPFYIDPDYARLNPPIGERFNTQQ